MIALFVLVLTAQGPQNSVHPFATLAECEKERATVGHRVADYNATADAKVVAYAAACAAVEKAKQGKDA